MEENAVTPTEMIATAMSLRYSGAVAEATELASRAIEAEFARSESGPYGRVGSHYCRQPFRRHTLDTVARTSFVEFFEISGRGGRLWAVGVWASASRTTPEFVTEHLLADGWVVSRCAARNDSLLVELGDDVHLSLQWSTESGGSTV